MMVFILPEELRIFPLSEVAARILVSNTGGSGALNLNTFLRTAEQGLLSNEADRERLLGRLADAWALLEAYALIAPSHRSGETGTNWQRVSELGQRLVADSEALEDWGSHAEDRLFGRSLRPAQER